MQSNFFYYRTSLFMDPRLKYLNRFRACLKPLGTHPFSGDDALDPTTEEWTPCQDEDEEWKPYWEKKGSRRRQEKRAGQGQVGQKLGTSLAFSPEQISLNFIYLPSFK